MGKVHRIKRRFVNVVTHVQWDTILPHHVVGYRLGEGIVLHCGVRFDGSRYVGYYGAPYKALLRKLIRDHEAG